MGNIYGFQIGPGHVIGVLIIALLAYAAGVIFRPQGQINYCNYAFKKCSRYCNGNCDAKRAADAVKDTGESPYS